MGSICQYATVQLNTKMTKLIFTNVKKFSTREKVIEYVVPRLNQ